MKILFIAPYITTDIHKSFYTKSKQTGFGYMVYDIADYVGRKEEVDLFATVIMSPTLHADHFKIVGHNYFSMLRCFNIRSTKEAICFLRKYRYNSIISKIKTIFKFIIVSQLDSIIENYDIVHIHGVTEDLGSVMEMCKNHNVKFMVTLHGLIGFSEETTINEEPGLVQYEKDFLVTAAQDNIPVTFISSGIKDIAESYVIKKLSE